MIALYLDGYSVDLKEQAVSQTKQIGEFFDLKDRRTNHTGKIKISETGCNSLLLDGLNKVGSLSVKPYRVLTAVFEVNGIQTIQNGLARVLRHVKGEHFELSIQDGNVSLFNALSNKKLSDLDFSDINHGLDRAFYEANILNDYTTGFSYVRSLAGADEIKPLWDKSAPVLFIAYLFDKVMTEAGLTYEGQIFNNVDFTNKAISIARGFINPVTGSPDAPKYDFDVDAGVTFSGAGQFDTKEIVLFGDTSGTDFNTTQALNDPLTLSDGVGFLVDETGGFEVTATHVVNSSSNVTLALIKTRVYVDGQLIAVLDTGETTGFYVTQGQIITYTQYVEVTDQNQFGFNYDISHVIAAVQTYTIIPINFSQLIGDVSQVEFVKDVLQWYALQYQNDIGTDNYRFKTINEIITSDAEDISKYNLECVSREWTPKISQNNRLKYLYPLDDMNEYADHVFTIDNDTIGTTTSDLFSRPYNAPIYFDLDMWRTRLYAEGPDYEVEETAPYWGIIEVVSGGFNYEETVSASNYNLVGDFNKFAFTKQRWSQRFPIVYTIWKDQMDRYEKIKGIMNFNALAMQNFDFLKLYYDKEIAQEFIVNRIGPFVDEKLARVEIIPIKGTQAAIS